MKRIGLLAGLCLALLFSPLRAQLKKPVPAGDERYRPALHFTPAKNWMNDPNGMVFHKGTYHLFYQYHPNSSVWGPMHWGHATSTDMVAWKHQPVAIYPDSLGLIFSGSAVLDVNNTSGLGTTANPPLVALFTYHDMNGEKAGRNDFQYQGLAWSNDDGKTWKKYRGNPVLRNPGLKDFRDPKVTWHAAAQHWVMTLAVGDRVHFYTSPNLKDWTKASEFGADAGAHGGVWECPDLFTMPLPEGGTKWVLLVNLNPGGPNKGSATQYFLGEFDGKTFTPDQTGTRWLDYGPDEYAGVTWSNTGNRTLLMGWMSNWSYAQVVPTETWRSAMTIARELKLEKAADGLRIASQPVNELDKYRSRPVTWEQLAITANRAHLNKTWQFTSPSLIALTAAEAKDITIMLWNEAGDTLEAGYDAATQQYFIDRTRAGQSAFHKDFAARAVAPRFTLEKETDLQLLVDNGSVELFADGGLTTMTALVFPRAPYSNLALRSPGGIIVRKVEYFRMKKAL